MKVAAVAKTDQFQPSCIWQGLPDYAVVEAGKYKDRWAFQINDPDGKVHELALNHVKGWRPVGNLLDKPDDEIKRYWSKVTPYFNKERNSLIFSVFSPSASEKTVIGHIDSQDRLQWTLIDDHSFKDVALENIHGLEPDGKVDKLFLERKEFPYRVEILNESPIELQFSDRIEVGYRNFSIAPEEGIYINYRMYFSKEDRKKLPAIEELKRFLQCSLIGRALGDRPILYYESLDGKVSRKLDENRTLRHYGISEVDTLVLRSSEPLVPSQEAPSDDAKTLSDYGIDAHGWKLPIPVFPHSASRSERSCTIWNNCFDNTIVLADRFRDQWTFRIIDADTKVHQLAMDQVRGWNPSTGSEDEIKRYWSRVYPYPNKERNGLIFTIFSPIIIYHADGDVSGSRALGYLAGGLAWTLLIDNSFREVAYGTVSERFLKLKKFPYNLEVLKDPSFELKFLDTNRYSICISLDEGPVINERIRISNTATIKDLKQEIQIRYRLQLGDEIELCLDGSEGRILTDLDDRKTLSYYGIDEYDTLIFRKKPPPPSLYALADMPFADMESEEFRDLQTKGKPWRKVSPGITLIGTCENQKCQAVGQRVLMGHGFGTFNMNKLYSTSECPCCKTIAQKIDNCGFLKCVFSVNGSYKGADGKPVSFEQKDQLAPNKKFLTFASEKQRDWLYMEVTVREKTRAERNSSEGHCQLL